MWDHPSRMVGTVPGTKDAALGHLLKSMDEKLLCETLYEEKRWESMMKL